MDLKNRLNKKNLNRGIVFASRAGDYVENRIGKAIETRYKTEDLPDDPREMTWYRVPLEKGLSGDGSEYYIYVKLADPKKLCIFFSGGGVAWNEYTAARPVTGGTRWQSPADRYPRRFVSCRAASCRSVLLHQENPRQCDEHRGCGVCLLHRSFEHHDPRQRDVHRRGRI